MLSVCFSKIKTKFQLSVLVDLSLMSFMTDTLLNVFLAIAVDNLANAQELTKVRNCFYL